MALSSPSRIPSLHGPPLDPVDPVRPLEPVEAPLPMLDPMDEPLEPELPDEPLEPVLPDEPDEPLDAPEPLDVGRPVDPLEPREPPAPELEEPEPDDAPVVLAPALPIVEVDAVLEIDPPIVVPSDAAGRRSTEAVRPHPTAHVKIDINKNSRISI